MEQQFAGKTDLNASSTVPGGGQVNLSITTSFWHFKSTQKIYFASNLPVKHPSRCGTLMFRGTPQASQSNPWTALSVSVLFSERQHEWICGRPRSDRGRERGRDRSIEGGTDGERERARERVVRVCVCVSVIERGMRKCLPQNKHVQYLFNQSYVKWVHITSDFLFRYSVWIRSFFIKELCCCTAHITSQSHLFYASISWTLKCELQVLLASAVSMKNYMHAIQPPDICGILL